MPQKTIPREDAMTHSILIELISALDILVLERLGNASFVIMGTVPDWFKVIYPNITMDNDRLDPSSISPFLENFLIDAEIFWNTHAQGQLSSGPWIEMDSLSREQYLEAIAVSMGHSKILLVEFCRLPYLDKQEIIQKGRQLSLDYDHLERMKRVLLKAHDKLEERIEQRTEELAKANELLRQEIVVRRQSEEALRQNEQFLRDIFNAIQDGIAVISKDFDIIKVNRWQEKMYGDAVDQIGQKCYRLYRGMESPCPWCAGLKTLETDAAHRRTFPYLTKGNQAGWIELSCFPLRNADGELVGIIEYSKDITEKKLAEEREAKVQAQLVQAQKMEAIGTLAGGIAHDFNNILGVIIGYADLALYETPADRAPRRHMQNVLDAGNRARELVGQILAFSYQTEEELQSVQVDQIAREVIKFARAVLPSTIELRQHIPASIRPVMAVPTQIHQVLMNLCTNAAQSMSEHGGVLEISLANEDIDSDFVALHKEMRPGPYVKLTVSDTGAGMPAGLLSRIFEPYFTTKEKGKGTGLGLAIVHGIVKSYGGVIEVQSEQGKGSSFAIYLPAIDHAAVARDVDSQAMQRGTERVLFIDDEETLAAYGKQALEHLGYHVTAKTDNLEALELFRRNPDQFDLIFCDVTMPNLTVDEVVQELLRSRPDIPIILYTGYSESISTSRVRGMGVKAFLKKPLTMKSLAEAVRGVLDNKD
jgi:PAS domain S-box-containing protein